jgi:hypothetical protein
MADGESPTEKLDRKWQDQLQELRVMQTGAQLTAGFLLTLPFQPSFGDLTTFQRGLYLFLVAVAALTVLLVVTPVAVHRKLTGTGIKEWVVSTGHVCVTAAIVSLGLLVTGMLTLIFHVVVGATTGFVVGGLALLTGVVLFLVVPLVVAQQD